MNRTIGQLFLSCFGNYDLLSFFFPISFKVLTLCFSQCYHYDECGHLQYPKKNNSPKDKVVPLGYFTWHPVGCLSDHSLQKGAHPQSPRLLSAHPSPPSELTSRSFWNWPALCDFLTGKNLTGRSRTVSYPLYCQCASHYL